MDATDQDQIDQSLRRVQLVDALAADPGFLEFIEALQGEAHRMGAEVLTDENLDPVQREAMRQQRIGLVMAIDYLPKFRDGAVKVLATYGMEPGDIRTEEEE